MINPIALWPDWICDALTQVTEFDVDLPEPVRDASLRFRAGQRDGAHLKELVRDASGAVWLAKSGQPAGAPKDVARNVAFPLHEALMPLIYGIVGVAANEVALGTRAMNVAAAPGYPMLVGFHKHRAGKNRGLISFTPSARYLADFACMCCVDIISGQSDRHNANYMVTDGENLFAIDSSSCMYRSWLNAPLTPDWFDELKRTGGQEGKQWDGAVLGAVRSRIPNLTPEAIDKAFLALPRVWVQLHDRLVYLGSDTIGGTIAQKRDKLKGNLALLHTWVAAQ